MAPTVGSNVGDEGDLSAVRARPRLLRLQGSLKVKTLISPLADGRAQYGIGGNTSDQEPKRCFLYISLRLPDPCLTP